MNIVLFPPQVAVWWMAAPSPSDAARLWLKLVVERMDVSPETGKWRVPSYFHLQTAFRALEDKHPMFRNMIASPIWVGSGDCSRGFDGECLSACVRRQGGTLVLKDGTYAKETTTEARNRSLPAVLNTSVRSLVVVKFDRKAPPPRQDELLGHVAKMGGYSGEGQTDLCNITRARGSYKTYRVQGLPNGRGRGTGGGGGGGAGGGESRWQQTNRTKQDQQEKKWQRMKRQSAHDRRGRPARSRPVGAGSSGQRAGT